MQGWMVKLTATAALQQLLTHTCKLPVNPSAVIHFLLTHTHIHLETSDIALISINRAPLLPAMETPTPPALQLPPPLEDTHSKVSSHE